MENFKILTYVLCSVVLTAFFPKAVSAQAEEVTLSSDTTIHPRTTEAIEAHVVTSSTFQECILIDFEGMGNNTPIGTIPGSPQIPQIVFGSSWLSLIDSDAGGSGNFANEPSPSTTAYFLDQMDISISFDAGIQLVEFYYSAAAQSLPVVVSAFDIDGNLVDRATGNTVGTSYDGAACSGDPAGAYCLWDKVTLASTSNNIRIISIAGTVSNYFGIDNLRVCIGECAPPSGQLPAFMRIPISDSCCWGNGGNCLERRNFAGSFWEDCLISEIVADSDEKVQLWCIAGFLPCNLAPGLGHYELHYFFPDGSHNKVGVCKFRGGVNDGVLFYSEDSDGNGKPDCLIRTKWTSYDQQVGDEDDDGDGKIDWWVFTYDVVNNNFNKVNYESTDGPGGPDPDVVARTDPPLGPETEAMLDELIAEFEQVATEEDNPMSGNPFDLSDLNRDGKYDASDLEIFDIAFGSCEGESNFNSDADFNGDGCVTVEDKNLLFPSVVKVAIDIKPGSYPNSINPNAGGVIPIAILTTEDFDASTVDPQTVALEGASAQGKGKSGRYGSMEDVDGDGDLDLVVQVANEIDWAENATEATLTGLTWDGIPIEGTDSVNIVPPK